MKYISAKSCIFKIYFAYVFFMKVWYICQNIFEIYSNAVEIYIFVTKSCVCCRYISFLWGKTRLTRRVSKNIVYTARRVNIEMLYLLYKLCLPNYRAQDIQVRSPAEWFRHVYFPFVIIFREIQLIFKLEVYVAFLGGRIANAVSTVKSAGFFYPSACCHKNRRQDSDTETGLNDEQRWYLSCERRIA